MFVFATLIGTHTRCFWPTRRWITTEFGRPVMEVQEVKLMAAMPSKRVLAS